MNPNRWKVLNVDYDWADFEHTRLGWIGDSEHPWTAYTPHPDAKYRHFATHAEVITYADKQARRTA